MFLECKGQTLNKFDSEPVAYRSKIAARNKKDTAMRWNREKTRFQQVQTTKNLGDI